MMYRHNTSVSNSRKKQTSYKSRSRHRRRKGRGGLLLLILAALVAAYLFIPWRGIVAPGRDQDPLAGENTIGEDFNTDPKNYVFRNRLNRESIPVVKPGTINYRETFNDSNYVQLSAARALGVDPSTVGDPAKNKPLVPIFNTELYKVDTMYHSSPYLIPEAVLLLDYIAQRFRLLMSEHYPEFGTCNIIVTSALRTDDSERRLRRVNRNATDTSCHMYGTTFDISAQRYLHLATGHDTVVEQCKQMLAMALYQLRYEGLCYVKYERGSCFHITLRTTQYEGKLPSKSYRYVNPGSPQYLQVKAPPRPVPRPVSSGASAEEDRQKTSPDPPAQMPTTEKSRQVKKTAESPKQGAKDTKDSKTANKKGDFNSVAPAPARQQKISERERISLEQFEKR
ncbi:MAG: hypothetical protein J6Y98_02305 [Bacteroidales bacterium]|nr:hypothetical protein [Bacteroidales bacterium]